MKIKRIKAIIFDVDNTLIDTGEISTRAYLETAKQFNLKQYGKKEIQKCFGIPSKKIIKVLWPKANVKKFKSIKEKKILKRKIKQIPSAKKVIQILSEKYKLGLLSSKSKVLMYPHLKQINLSINFFKFIFSADDVKFHKPDPRVFSKAIKKLNLKRNEILYVGDSIHDAEAARKAKLNFIAVLTGSYNKKDFQKHKIKDTNILKSIKDLPKWLEKNG